MTIEMAHHSVPELTPTDGVDRLPYDYIAELDQRFERKLFNPLADELATERLLARRRAWGQAGLTTVFTSGVFDMLHLDHAGYLLHTKATAAAVHYDRQHQAGAWDELSPEQQRQETSQALANQQLRLIVSVDGDASVAARKGHQADKGNTVRPIYGWRTRALMAARLAFVDPSDADGQRLLPTVDAVTIHGPQDFDPDHRHALHLDLVGALQPEAWAVFGESRDILEAVPARADLAAVALRVIQDGAGTHYYDDPIMGKMSTTAIAARLKGEDVGH